MMAEQQRPGSFTAMYLYEPVVLGPASTADDTCACLSTLAKPLASGFLMASDRWCLMLHAFLLLMAFRHTNAMVDGDWIRAARSAHAPGLLEMMAAKRRRTFASKQAAQQAFAKRPTFSAFSTDALTAYVEHGFRELPGVERFATLSLWQHPRWASHAWLNRSSPWQMAVWSSSARHPVRPGCLRTSMVPVRGRSSALGTYPALSLWHAAPTEPLAATLGRQSRRLPGSSPTCPRAAWKSKRCTHQEGLLH